MHHKLAYLVLGNSCNHPLANLLPKHLHPDQSKINKLLPPVLGPTTTDNNKFIRLEAVEACPYSEGITFSHSKSLSLSRYISPSISRLTD
jgi:hypothetical protein